jgi:hypothetical protein
VHLRPRWTAQFAGTVLLTTAAPEEQPARLTCESTLPAAVVRTGQPCWGREPTSNPGDLTCIYAHGLRYSSAVWG